ncbi:RnfABCDGE type electron transport complex subunit A [bacterium]|nr:RnfABCDGE type electron transport complex subunit A [bacterium]
MDFGRLFVITISTIFINNFVLSRFLGLCPFFGVSRKMSSAVGMGLAVIFVMAMTAFVTWPIYYLVLVPYDITYLSTIVFILVIAALVQFVEIVLAKTAQSLYQALGIYLPLITTNCCVLGVAVLNINDKLNFVEALVQGTTAGMGFTVALLLMAGIRERIELARVPSILRGIPIALICAGLMSIAFLGFAGFNLK